MSEKKLTLKEAEEKIKSLEENYEKLVKQYKVLEIKFLDSQLRNKILEGKEYGIKIEG